jgi:signal transduction histidine kinase
MSVRFKIALTIFLTGVLTAIGVIGTVLFAFDRFERESSYYRAAGFLGRVVNEHVDMLGMQERFPDEFSSFLRNLVLFEPDTQLYLLGMDGAVIASSVDAALPLASKVNLDPVKQASGAVPMPYVMGDDPQRMDASAVVAARALRRSVILKNSEAAGYLYVVIHKPVLADHKVAALQGTFIQPALLVIGVVVAFSTLLAAWAATSMTRPLAQLSAAVAHVTRDGLGDLARAPALSGQIVEDLPRQHRPDEFGQLGDAIRSMLDALRTQWDALRRLDHFRREGVSNLSHDLRSPLTATVACLETLEQRWAAEVSVQTGAQVDRQIDRRIDGKTDGKTDRKTDRDLLHVALRNTRNAARLVQSLGDLAQLDEPEYKLRREAIDLTEFVDDLALRFADRAERAGVVLTANGLTSDNDPLPELEPIWVSVDVELLERAVANVIDNALKFCAPSARIQLDVFRVEGSVGLRVVDTGAGIAAADLPHLFDRHYQARQSVAPASADGGKGLGLAIVKRIAELHGGRVEVASEIGVGTAVTLTVPALTNVSA